MTPPARILVVDDEPAIVESLVDFLSTQDGYLVTAAYDGRAAMTLLQTAAQTPDQAVDLVLLDMRMPEMSGLDVLAWIRRQPHLQTLRVMMLTAASGNKEKVEALSAGANDYITKPYYPEELLARVQTMLRSRQLEKQLEQQSRQLAALNRVSNAVTATLETGQVLNAAVTGARALFDVALVAIFMHRQDALVCQGVWSDDPALTPDAFASIRHNQGAIGQVFQRQKGVCLNAPLTRHDFRPEVDAPAGFTVTSLLAAPLVVRGRSVGVLCAYNKQQESFTDVDMDLFASLAGTVGRAIENAWLFQSVRQRQQELLESRNTLTAAIDGILHPIYTINESWRLVAVNQTKAAELDATPESLVEQVCYRVFFGRDTPCDHCQVSLILAEQQARRWAVHWPSDNDFPREWEVNAYPIPGAMAGAARVVVVWQDMTEARRMEQSLLRAGKLAAIGQLAAGVAHEINNPLTVITANAQMLKMGLTPKDSRYELVDLISLAGDRAARVVRGLLDFARQEQYDFQPAGVNDSIGRALELLWPQVLAAGITLRRTLAADLPDVVASWDHLTSVWLNLLINARDAVLGVQGERLIEIVTRLAPAGDAVQVLVRDNGPGIPAVHLNRIFEPFYTTKAPGEGTGLGLATSHRIVEQHGGTIEVVSTAGTGTTFMVSLPIKVKEISSQ